MAAMKQAKAPNRHQTIQSNPAPPTPAPRHFISPPEPAVNGKKKKKKKSKAKSSAETDAQGLQTDDDMPSLDPPNPQQTITTTTATATIPSPRRTGLSPELESVHLSTTASLSASAAAAARLNATAAAQAELLATANNLYRQMDSDTIPDDEDYWAALPAHIKNFVKMTYSTSTNPNVNASERSKAQSMLAIAHQMIQSGVEKTSPKGGGGGGGQPPGAFPSLPFDPAIFSDPAFLAMEQTLAGNPLPPAPGQPPRGPLPHPSVVLLNEYNGDEHHDYDYSEDEVDDNVEEHDHEAAFVGYEYRTNNNANNAAVEAGKKKSKKKKKKGGATMVNTIPTAPPPPSAPQQQQPQQHQQQPPASRPAPPSNPPVPSSRAAGKQPMSYNTNASLPPSQNPPPRSARTTNATPKAPHHHPSPASSQTSHGKTNANTNTNTNTNANANANANANNANNSNTLNTNTTAASHSSSQNKLWSTNSNEERERIKEFWLGLSEEERRALVKVEKEAVLRKMKEQQKHSCSCAVCGRKRYASSLPSISVFFLPNISVQSAYTYTLVMLLKRNWRCYMTRIMKN